MSKLYYFGLQLVLLAGLTHVSTGCIVMDFPLRMFQISLSGFREGLRPPGMDAEPEGTFGKIFDYDVILFWCHLLPNDNAYLSFSQKGDS